jgi:dihydrofolate reductase
MIGLIVARSKNNVIGKDGKIPWKIKGEQKQFKELTTQNTIIMGRKTYEDIGHPLPKRKNIVISRTTNYPGVITVDSLEKAIELSEGNIFIIGGKKLFKEAIPMVDIMYITEINLFIEGEKDRVVTFPDFIENDFDIIKGEETTEYRRSTYIRKKVKFR